jgi:hypothetical protein
MSKFAYWKVSAVFVFIAVVSNLNTLILLASACSGETGHCGG